MTRGLTPAQTELATLIAAQHEEWASERLATMGTPLRPEVACAFRAFARDTAGCLANWIVVAMLAMPLYARRQAIAYLIGIDQ